MSNDKTLKERAGQALGFELLALMICAPVMSRVLDTPLTDSGALTLMFSMLAMLWNVVFNLLFDRALRRLALRRTLRVRAAHALLFEAGMMVMLVPVGAWWLAVSLWEAWWIDIGIMLFFLPYTFVFNWVYDAVRATIVRRRRVGATGSAGF
jgi:uncharacterized membrane protein